MESQITQELREGLSNAGYPVPKGIKPHRWLCVLTYEQQLEATCMHDDLTDWIESRFKR